MQTNPTVLSRRFWRRSLVLTGVLLATLGGYTATARADLGGGYPAPNALLTSSPGRISVAVPQTAGSGTINLVSAAGRPIQTLHGPTQDGELTAKLQAPLSQGVYTAVWAAGTHRGSFGFSVSKPGTPATLVNDQAPKAELNPLWMGLPRFFAFAMEMTMIGTLTLWFLVTRPAVTRRRAEVEVGTRIDRRLLQVAAVSGLLFIPAYLSQLVVESADPDLVQGFWAMIKPGYIWTYLTTTSDGHVWEARLVLVLLAVALLVPTAAITIRQKHRFKGAELVMKASLAAGVAELLARVIPTETPDNWAREIFTQLLDFGHLLSASIWVGGLVGLATLATTVPVIAEQKPELWGDFLKEFGTVALICVGALILTGLWTFWQHVGSPLLLLHTLYGETLLVKLILVAVLVALGAVNKLWLLPRVEALKANGADGSQIGIALREFRHVVVVEAVLGLAILFVVPQLAGSARSQSYQQHGGGLTTVAQAGPTQISLLRSGLEPGTTDYDLTIPNQTGPVSVTFALPQKQIPPTTVPAIATGPGTYRISGIYTGVVGNWQATVRAAGLPNTTLSLPVQAVSEGPLKPLPPGIKLSTWIWGVGWVLATVLALLAAGAISRMQIQRKQRVGVAPA